MEMRGLALRDGPAELGDVFQAQRPFWAWLFILSVWSEGNEGGESAAGPGRPGRGQLALGGGAVRC